MLELVIQLCVKSVNSLPHRHTVQPIDVNAFPIGMKTLKSLLNQNIISVFTYRLLKAQSHQFIIK